MELTLESEGVLVPRSTTETIDFEFFKELNSDNLFRVIAQPYFESTEAFVRELSAEKNDIYRFAMTGSNEQIHYNNVFYNNGIDPGEDAYELMHHDGSDLYYVYYSQNTGELLGLYKNSDGNYYESGTLFDFFDQLEFKDNATLGIPVFYDVATGGELYEDFPEVPADQLIITNYTRNSTTGVLTFDYELKISGYNSTSIRVNTTNHDLTIKGKFNSGGKVHTNITGRVKS
jgi:hypothetical protein